MEVRAQMRCAFTTEGEVVALTASGTGAMEAALAGLFRPGERVYVPVAGKFSERWAEIAEAWGLEVYRRDYPWGHALTEADVARDLEDEPIAGALLTHSETSTGVLHPLPALAGAIRSCCPEALVVVDAVTSLFVAPFALDPWGVDAAVTGSQKGLMLPRGSRSSPWGRGPCPGSRPGATTRTSQLSSPSSVRARPPLPPPFSSWSRRARCSRCCSLTSRVTWNASKGAMTGSMSSDSRLG